MHEDIAKQIDKLAREAGEREATRVAARLLRRFNKPGGLPASVCSAIVQLAKLPSIEAAGGRVAPPVVVLRGHLWHSQA